MNLDWRVKRLRFFPREAANAFDQSARREKKVGPRSALDD